MDKREYHRIKTAEWRKKNPERNKVSRIKYKHSEKGIISNRKYQTKRSKRISLERINRDILGIFWRLVEGNRKSSKTTNVKKKVYIRIKNNYLSTVRGRKISMGLKKYFLENPKIREEYSERMKSRIISKETRVKMKEHRKNQILPLKDTSIEIKIQNFLSQLHIEFITHKYIKEIEHAYQCDIFIPSLNLIIECDGCYWHNCPFCHISKNIETNNLDKDKLRTIELKQKGFKVLRLWEHDIKNLDIDKFEQILTNEIKLKSGGK